MTNKCQTQKITTFFIAAIFSVSTFAQNSEPMFEEIIVTAEKRSESLQDLSQAVTVLSGLDLDNRQI